MTQFPIKPSRGAAWLALAMSAVLLIGCWKTRKGGTGADDFIGEVDPPPPPPSEFPITINEVLVEDGPAQAPGAPPAPWLELFNPSDQTIDLCDVPLSGDPADSARWTIPCRPETVLPPGGYLIILLDGQEGAPGIHANFTIVAGDPIQLTLNRGVQNFLYFGDFEPGASVARLPDAGPKIGLAEPTPGQPNREKEVHFIRGDANGNGRVNVSDLARLVQVIESGQPPPPCLDPLDVDDDGQLGPQDIAFIRDFLFTNGPKPPAPFPDQGTDPTPDQLPCSS